MQFNPFDGKVTSPWQGGKANCESLFESINELVLKRLERFSGQTAAVVPIDCPGFTESDSRNQPSHRVCIDCQRNSGCRNSWLVHLAELDENPRPHWHRCDYGNFCGVVPVIASGRCLAACKMVCPGNMSEQEFLRTLELLTILVENFRVRCAALLTQLVGPEPDQPDASSLDLVIPDHEARQRARHPQVVRAIEHIEHNLSDTSLNVANIAKLLEINSTYLAHLFSVQVGIRMSRYIAERRVELAKKLLATTNWQIKRVAYESGHANADWFSQVFRSHTEMSPRDFRRKNRLINRSAG